MTEERVKELSPQLQTDCCAGKTGTAISTVRQGCECGGGGAMPLNTLPAHDECGCGDAGSQNTVGSGSLHILPMVGAGEADDEPCCGPPQSLPASPYEKAGYRICPYVEGFKGTAVGMVPRVAANLTIRDRLGTMRARSGYLRDQYKVAPGLYCVGEPDKDSSVLVTANYKLTFDSLRRELHGLNVWLLVLDTRGVNVWCAAGKKNFSTEEIIKRVGLVRLDRIVSHRQLILPQLAAPGVSAHQVKKGCGFGVTYGPIRARDIREYLAGGNKATASMRQVTFSIRERVVLVPVEIYLIIKPTPWIILGIFLISGIGPGVFAVSDAWNRGATAILAYLAGVAGGAVAVPVLLPWLPSRKFYVKGMFTGLAAGWLVVGWFHLGFGWETVALVLLSMAASSYAAMNFTGTTPFTSPTGVEKEMRQGIPLQALSTLAAVLVWLTVPFIH
jgi:hypothetical protein